MIQYEKEILDYLNLPSIPKKEHDGKTNFDKGVAVIELRGERLAYAVCVFNQDNGDKSPRIIKAFGIEPFIRIKNVFVVPDYMTSMEDVKSMDLDDESKKKAEQLLNEANEIENDGVVEKELESPKNEYYFDHIHNDEEARAYIQNYNSRNRIKGRIPTTHEGLVLRLAVIYSSRQKKNKKQ